MGGLGFSSKFCSSMQHKFLIGLIRILNVHTKKLDESLKKSPSKKRSLRKSSSGSDTHVEVEDIEMELVPKSTPSTPSPKKRKPWTLVKHI